MGLGKIEMKRRALQHMEASYVDTHHGQPHLFQNRLQVLWGG